MLSQDEWSGGFPVVYYTHSLMDVGEGSALYGKDRVFNIERATYDDVAFRYLGAGNFPDFRTINEFRRIHLKALSKLFVQILRLCKDAGMIKPAS